MSIQRLEITRTETEHRGHACYRQRRDGGVTVMCPYGHLVDNVAPRHWGTSVWSHRAAWGEDVVTCHGKLLPNAVPYPFNDTFVGVTTTTNQAEIQSAKKEK